MIIALGLGNGRRAPAILGAWGRSKKNSARAMGGSASALIYKTHRGRAPRRGRAAPPAAVRASSSCSTRPTIAVNGRFLTFCKKRPLSSGAVRPEFFVIFRRDLPSRPSSNDKPHHSVRLSCHTIHRARAASGDFSDEIYLGACTCCKNIF